MLGRSAWVSESSRVGGLRGTQPGKRGLDWSSLFYSPRFGERIRGRIISVAEIEAVGEYEYGLYDEELDKSEWAHRLRAAVRSTSLLKDCECRTSLIRQLKLE